MSLRIQRKNADQKNSVFGHVSRSGHMILLSVNLLLQLLLICEWGIVSIPTRPPTDSLQPYTAQKMKFVIKDFFSKCEQLGFGHIYWKVPLWKTSFFVHITCIPIWNRFKYFNPPKHNFMAWQPRGNLLVCTAWKVSVFQVFLVRIFPHWMYLSAFSSNAGK